MVISPAELNICEIALVETKFIKKDEHDSIVLYPLKDLGKTMVY